MCHTGSQIDLSNDYPWFFKDEIISVRQLYDHSFDPSVEIENLKNIHILRNDNDNDDKYVSFSFKEKLKKQSPVIKQINNIVDNIRIPKKWSIQSINPPNINCKELTKKIAQIIYHSYAIFPIRIAPSIEEGVLLNYKNFDNKKEMAIEIYNDLDIAAIIICKNSILKSSDIENENFLEVINIFKDV